MQKESVVVSALQDAGFQVAKEGVKAVQKLPKGQRKKVAGAIILVATLVFLVLAARKLRANTM